MKKSFAALIASWPEADRDAFLEGLSGNALAAMPWIWDLWALPEHQREPDGDWTTWVIMGGRGAGKTRAGAEWVRARVEGAGPKDPGPCRRVALVGETMDQVRAVMVEGDSGILACSPEDRRPELITSKNKLVWPNGAEAMLVSATNYEALRGPQFDAAWCDELAKWRHGQAAWDMLQFTLRLGDHPRVVVTTTPRDVPILHKLIEQPDTVLTQAPTAANAANLAPGFMERMEAEYGGTWFGRQELMGELVEHRSDALWSHALIDRARMPAPEDLDRIVVAVDPPVTGGASADECGIVVAGVRASGPRPTWEAWILADLSVAGQSPQGWAARAADAYETFSADRLVAEVNQGGDLVETVLRQVAPDLSYRKVHARVGKRLRAEPVAALYEQGRIHHVGVFPELEDQMCSFTAGHTGPSPDRLDALVWALTDLIVTAPDTGAARVRTL